MKKLLILFISLTMVFVFTACETDNENTNDTGVPTYAQDSTASTNEPTETAESTESSTSANNTTTPSHVHTFGEWTIETPSSCTQVGTKVKVCSCGEKKTEEIPVAEHNKVVVKAISPTCTTDGKTEGCYCADCDAVLVAQTVIPKTGHSLSSVFTKTAHKSVCSRCDYTSSADHTFANGTSACTECPFFKETVPSFEKGTITTEKTYIETEYAIIEIDPNIYVIEGLAKKVDTICRALEHVTGLSFKNSSYGNKKIGISVSKSGEFASDSEAIGDGLAFQGPFTNSRGDECMHHVRISAIDLLIGKHPTILHELAHVLRYYQSDYHYASIVEEGFATHLTTLTHQYIDKHHPALSLALSGCADADYEYSEGLDRIYDEDIFKWFSDGAGVIEDYSYGELFFKYLKSVYGDYTSWMTERKTTPSSIGSILSPKDDYELFKTCYNLSVFDGFFPWLKQNLDTLRVKDMYSPLTPYTTTSCNIKNVRTANVYPFFTNYAYNYARLAYYSFYYKDLYVNIEETRQYLGVYKKQNIDNLELSLTDSVKVQLFDAEGCLLSETTEKLISLKGVSYIKLVGEGYLGSLEIIGFYDPAIKFDKPTVLYSGTLSDQGGKDTYAQLLWTEFVVWSDYYYDRELFFRNDVEITVKLSAPCVAYDVYDTAWNYTEKIENVTNFVISDLRGWYLLRESDSSTPVTFEIIATPVK